MNREIRDLLLAALDPALASVDPAFLRSGSYRSPAYEARVGATTYRLEVVFKSADEAFSADLAWGPPSTLSLDPASLTNAGSGSFRIDLLWSAGGSWWEVRAPPPPAMARRSAADIFKQSANRVTVECAASQIPALVADFRDRVLHHVVPYVLRRPR